MKASGNIKIVLEGRGPLTLRPNNYVATGGEGSIYRIGKTIIKLFTDVNKMRRDSMSDKIRLLSTINNRFIVCPKGLVKDASGQDIGYYMDYTEGEPLSRVFTNDFRKRENFGDDQALVLVDNMKKTVEFAHSKKAILVDANETNWLVNLDNHSNPEPRIIDVDSWAIDRWQASVVMPSIFDWHAKGFDQFTDWFSWGVVTFQIFTGIHPYKGKLDGYKPNDLEKRMKANLSVFTQGVRLNRAVRDFSKIPGPLLDWYVQTFQQGKRFLPPSPFDKGNATVKIARVLHAVTTASGVMVFDKLYSKVNDPVVRVFSCGIVLHKSGRLVDLSSRREISTVKSYSAEVVKVVGGWLKADIEKNNIIFSYISETNFSEESLPLNIDSSRLVRYDNRLFVVTGRGLTEIILKKFAKPILTVGQTWGVMINSTKWFDGLGVQDAMGASYVIAPFEDSACAQIRVRELDGIKPITAKAGNRFIIIVGLDKDGNYKKIELTLSRDYQDYKAWVGVVDDPNLNISILPKGVCASIVDDGQLDIYVPVNGKLNQVKDKDISTNMALANWDNKVVYIKNGEVWTARLKSN